MLIAKATNLHGHRLRQFVREKTDVNTGASVNVRRILVSEKEGFHAREELNDEARMSNVE
jgi:hypothetical protein